MTEVILMNAATTRRRIRREFLLFSSSILLITCSYSGLADLQSSINVIDGLGTSSLTVTYSATIVFSLFVTPIVVRQWGAKMLILVGEACFLVYVVANFYPRFWSLIPAGLVLGFGEATLFTPALMYCTHYGRIFANIGRKSVNVYVKQFIGYFYCIVQMNEVISNLISYIVLRVGRTLHQHNLHQQIKSNYTNHTLIFDSNCTTGSRLNSTVNHIYSKCGANDCYDEVTIENMKKQYVPMSSTALYIMISILTSLGLLAIVIFAYFIPDLPKDGLSETDTDNNSNAGESKVKDISDLQNSSPLIQSLSHISRDNPASSVCGIIQATISSTFKHMANSQQVLLTPLTFYHGMYITFISSEINRAFVSCVVGVEQIGIVMVLGGMSNVLVALMFGAFSAKIGTKILLLLAVLLDLSSYAFCLFWQPTKSNSWLAYALVCVLGSTDGIWQPLLDAKYADYFSENEEIAFAISNLWTCAGFTLMYGWSTFLCMPTKIYIMIAVMLIGLVCYVVAENRPKVETLTPVPSVIPVHVGPSSRL